ncbi:VOC family protein [Zavarzinia sp.]|uniref:VOC family protein n=1 Tax=Zavarzinia sp. TaxID=2027920 RepID=UPI003569E40B
MSEFSFVLLYVADAQASGAFYSKLLGRPLVEDHPGFAMLPLREGVMLGLWARDTVEPLAAGTPGSGEIAFSVADADAVAATHADWKARGLAIAQTPTAMNFGTTFVALDPDGHRLRVFART